MARVSIGLPVYNGENFLATAVDSVLRQSFCDWELIISDNASTDGTERLCQDYAASEPRITYIRQPENVGAAPNFNATFHLACGEYFQWLAHDDYLHPQWLEKCVDVLDHNSEAELVYGQELGVDDAGAIMGKRPYLQANAQPTRVARMYAILGNDRGSPAIFGLMRRATLQRTHLIGGYDASDQVLLVDLAMQGEFVELPDWLYFHREHDQRSVNAYRDRHAANKWFATHNRGKTTFPEWRLMREYLRVIGRAPCGSGERWRCLMQFLRWAKYQRRYRRLGEDLIIAARGVKK